MFVDQVQKYIDMFEEAVPGNHFNHTHRHFDHVQMDFCPESTIEEAHDLFENPHAKSYTDLLTPSEEEMEKIMESYESGDSYDSDEERYPLEDN